MKLFFLALSLTFIYGCRVRLTSDQRAYLETLISTPSEFVVPKSRTEECRGKAQTWLARYTKMKPQIITEYIVVTYNGVAEGDYSYVVTFEPRGDSTLIAVSCRGGGVSDTDYKMLKVASALKIEESPWDSPTISLRNEKILAYYLMTGNNPYPELIEW